MKKIYSILCMFIAVSAMVSCSNDDDEIVPSTLNSINSFEIDFEGLTADDVTYDLGNTITISVPFGTNLSALVAAIGIDTGATVSPASGASVDYVDGVAMPFTVTAEDAITVKTYNVIINIRGEVGSGTKLKTYSYKQDYGFFAQAYTDTFTYDENSNFVSTITTVQEWEDDLVQTLVYDAKNQVIEIVSEGEKTEYSYNAEGQIEQAVYTKGDIKKYTYDYTYDDNGSLATEVRLDHEEEDDSKNKYNQAYKVEGGNLIQMTQGASIITDATYDDKNNPFNGIYPTAYAKILISMMGVGVNNAITISSADDVITYIYNNDDYPLSGTHGNAEAGTTTTREFTYFE